MNNFKLYRKLRGGIWLLLGYIGQGDKNNLPYHWVRVKDAHDTNLQYFIAQYTSDKGLSVMAIEMYGALMGTCTINTLLTAYRFGGNKDNTVGLISDGYHTFDELYEHRNVLFINLLNGLNRASRRSKV